MKKSNHLKTVLLVSAMLMLGVTGRAQSHGNRLMPGSILPTAISNGTRTKQLDMSLGNPSGTTTALGD